uniref:Tetratricopeptide repeat domain 6 n=1 Tax=Sarcophilus harrisii TaxID=9305 RepID=A0A7N4UX02_SARHA
MLTCSKSKAFFFFSRPSFRLITKIIVFALSLEIQSSESPQSDVKANPRTPRLTADRDALKCNPYLRLQQAMYNKMSRVPRHFGLSYDEELKMLKELEKVRKQTREDFLKFKLVQKSKSKRSLLPFSALPRGFNNYSSQSSDSSYQTIAKDKFVPPELYSSVPQDKEKQSHDLRRKIQGSKLPFKKSRKMTSLADRPGHQPLCLKEFYLKNTVNIYQRSKEKPVIASLAGTSKQAILFKQPAPPRKSRYRRVIFRRKSPIFEFPCASRKSVRKSEPPSLPESYRTEEIISKEPMTSEQEAEKISLRKRRWVGPRKEGISYSFLTEKKRKKSLISSAVVDVQMQELPETEVPTIEKEEPQEEEPEKKIPSKPLSMKDIPRSIEEIIDSLQSERQSAVDKMIKDLIESVLGQNYNIKMEEVSLITKYQEKDKEAAAATEESEDKESTAEVLVPPEKIERMAEDELSSLQTDYELDVEEPKAEREHVELLQTVLDTKILSELPTLLDTTQNKLPKWIPGPFQVSHLESLKITGKTAMASPRAKPKSQIRRFPAEVSQISKATSKIPHKQSIHTLHKLCIAAPEFVLPTDLQLASKIYHTKDKAGHDTFLRRDKRDSADDSIRNEKEKNRILYGISTTEPEDNICPETSTNLVKWKKTDEKPSLHLSGEEVSMYPGSVKMFWVPAPPKFSAPVSLIRQTLYPQYESSCTFKYVVEKQFSESQESFLSKKRHKKIELPKMRVRKSKSFSNFQKITEGEAEKSPKRSTSAFNFTMQRDSILPMIPDDLQSNMNEIRILQEHVLNTMAYETNKDITADENLNVTEPSHLQNELIQPSEQKETIQLEPARKTRTSYILFPKRKRRKLRKKLNIEKINSVLKELSKPPKTLERSKSLVILREQKKFFLHVPIYFRRSRCPSLPAVLNFNEFVQKHGGIPKNKDPQQWVLDFWVQELQDTLPTKESEHVEKEIIQIPIEPVKPPEEKKILKIELDDFSNPGLSEEDKKHLECEIENLTEEIKEKKKMAALLYCRRGAIYRKLGKLKKALNDLQEAIFLEPLLLNAYWHRHFIYLFLDRTADALDDLNYITKYNKNNADVYLSKAEIFRKKGNFTLTLLNYTQAIKCRPTDDDIYFKRAEMLGIENKLLAMGDYSKIHKLPQAVRDMSRAIHLQPDGIQLYIMRGRYLLEMKRYDLAKSTIFQVARMNKGSFELSPIQQSLVFSFCNQHKEALKILFSVTLCRPEPAIYMLLGKAQMKAKKIQNAVITFKRALDAISPTDKTPKGSFLQAECHYHLGLCYMEEDFFQMTYKLAIKDLNIAIAMNKACFLAFYNRAICYNKIKEFHLALKDYGIVLLLNVGDDIKAKTLINRGLIYTELKMIANALEDFKEAVQINKDDANLFQAAGICHHRMGEFEEAVCSFTRVIELNPFFVDAYVGRGNSYMEYGHEVADKQAQKDFIKALHFNPAYSKTRISLGYNLQAQGKFQKAWNHFTICMDIDPGNCLAYEGRGIVCLQMGDNFAAIQDINSALKITISAEFLTNRGVIHEFMGERHIAMKDYQAALSISPEYSLAYFNAGNIYLHHRQFSQASDFYSKALQFDPLNDSAVLNRAITNIILQKFEEAKQDFIKAIHLCPFWAAVYYNKAHLYYCLQQYETAEEDLSKALSLQPNDHLAYKLRADVHGKMGMMEEALKDYNQSLDLQEFAKV